MATLERCVQCGGIDDHPKVHLGEGVFGAGGVSAVRSKHLDCLSADETEMLTSHPHFGHLHAEAIDAAKSGIHGDDLRVVTEGHHKEQNKIIARMDSESKAANAKLGLTDEGAQ